MKSDKFECGDFTRENMPVQLLLAQVGHMYKWYVTKQMKDTELKAGQAGILAILQMVGPMSQRELADHIHITPPSVNVAVQKLEKLGYIRKEQDEKVILHELFHLKNILCRRLLLQMSDNLFQEKEFRDMPCKNPFKE